MASTRASRKSPSESTAAEPSPSASASDTRRVVPKPRSHEGRIEALERGRRGTAPAIVLVRGDSDESIAAARAVAMAPYEGREQQPQVIVMRTWRLEFPDAPASAPVRPAPRDLEPEVAPRIERALTFAELQEVAAYLRVPWRNVTAEDIVRHRAHQREQAAREHLAAAARAAAPAQREALLDDGWRPLATRKG